MKVILHPIVRPLSSDINTAITVPWFRVFYGLWARNTYYCGTIMLYHKSHPEFFHTNKSLHKLVLCLFLQSEVDFPIRLTTEGASALNCTNNHGATWSHMQTDVHITAWQMNVVQFQLRSCSEISWQSWRMLTIPHRNHKRVPRHKLWNSTPTSE